MKSSRRGRRPQDETDPRALVDPPDVELAHGELWGQRSTHLKTASNLIDDHPIERGLHLRTGPRPVPHCRLPSCPLTKDLPPCTGRELGCDKLVETNRRPWLGAVASNMLHRGSMSRGSVIGACP